jgi:hypothetical protein
MKDGEHDDAPLAGNVVVHDVREDATNGTTDTALDDLIGAGMFHHE